MKGERRHDIIEAFARNSSLTSMTLAINNYGDMKGEWGYCLVEGLARNTSLNSLTLTTNYYGDMSDEWGFALRESLRKSKSLTECNLIVDICMWKMLTCIKITVHAATRISFYDVEHNSPDGSCKCECSLN
ncbi:PREDICTED: uncharacterized protein LOC107343671 isoform X2 [Acropora digitifera]|uniref:uncharacterized protein LOC107343671 isoform X2 n=1 Tax=Acropora digitifera TaxID=70779 RepID=UPI00077A8B3F|nr:PREDICTED: uncharacterized protein LOC107343671 isoform X2 [Acropora digitifera]